MINPSRKTAYSVRKLWASTDFDTPDDIRQELQSAFQEIPDDSDLDLEIGYVTPGHGARGQQRWITLPQDIQDMYEAYKGKKQKRKSCCGSISQLVEAAGLDRAHQFLVRKRRRRNPIMKASWKKLWQS